MFQFSEEVFRYKSEKMIEKINVRPNSIPEKGNVLPHPEFSTYESRLITFHDWPISIQQQPEELANAGFYYTGMSDKTICFSCGGGLKNWEEHDIPLVQHKICFPRCNYLKKFNKD